MAPISQDLEPPATAGRFKALSPEVMLSAQTFLWFGGRREEGSVGPREDGSRSNDHGSIQKATGLDEAAARASQAQSSGKQVATERQSSSLRARHSIRDQEGWPEGWPFLVLRGSQAFRIATFHVCNIGLASAQIS